MDIGVGVLPKLPRDAGDRNRTSPFAFTGNKFEFRAVSANQGIAMPNIALNVAVTESLDYCATELEASLKAGKKLEEAVKLLLSKVVKESKGIIFNGNNYADEWQKEAGQARPAQPRTSVDAFGESLKPEVIKAFEQYGVLNERELKARHEIALEQYNKTVNIEAQLMVLMANRSILPAAYRFQGELGADASRAVKAAGASAKESRKALDEVTPADRRVPHQDDRAAEAARARGERRYRASTRSTSATRSFRRWTRCARPGDALETMVPQDLWPLPTYREMLFVK